MGKTRKDKVKYAKKNNNEEFEGLKPIKSKKKYIEKEIYEYENEFDNEIENNNELDKSSTRSIQRDNR